MSSEDSTYLLSRGTGPSTRLLAQHWLWKDLFGWNLHPDARKGLDINNATEGTAKPLAIADVATGNAIWLVEEAQKLPAGSTAVGFDISRAMFPAQHTLPPNVKLEILDVAAGVPVEYIGAFDIIHIRLVVAAVRNNDPRPILINLIRMLKPGGFLQWGEITLEPYVLGKPLHSSETAIMKVIARMEMAEHIGAAGSPPGDSWLLNLPAIFEECGLEDVKCTSGAEPPRVMWKHWADIISGAVEEMIATTGLGREFLPDLAAEREAGDYVFVEPRIVVGRKAV